MDITRRTAIKGAAWAAPVIAVAVAAPAAAATTPPADCWDKLIWDNKNLDIGAPNTLTVNAKIDNTFTLNDGVTPWRPADITFEVWLNGTLEWSNFYPQVGNNGNTGQISHTFTGLPKGTYNWEFRAYAPGFVEIFASDTVVAPDWWA